MLSRSYAKLVSELWHRKRYVATTDATVLIMTALFTSFLSQNSATSLLEIMAIHCNETLV